MIFYRGFKIIVQPDALKGLTFDLFKDGALQGSGYDLTATPAALVERCKKIVDELCIPRKPRLPGCASRDHFLTTSGKANMEMEQGEDARA